MKIAAFILIMQAIVNYMIMISLKPEFILRAAIMVGDPIPLIKAIRLINSR